MFNSKVVWLVGLLGVAIGGCAAEPGEETADRDGDKELGTVSSPVYTDISPQDLRNKLEIKNRSNNLCLEVIGGVAAVGTRVNEAPCARSRNQSFHLLQPTFAPQFQIVWRQAPDLCVGIAGSASTSAPTVLVACRNAQGVAMANSIYRLDNLINFPDPLTSQMSFRLPNISGPTGAGTACLDGDIAAPAWTPPVIQPSPIPGIIPKTPLPPRQLRPAPTTPSVLTLGCNNQRPTQVWTVTNWF